MRLHKIIFLCVLAISVTTPSFSDVNSRLSKQLAYLKKIPEVADVIIDQNNVYIGFDHDFSDMSTIVKGAAVIGNNFYGSRVHVWGYLYGKHVSGPEDWTFRCLSTGQDGQFNFNIFAKKVI